MELFIHTCTAAIETGTVGRTHREWILCGTVEAGREHDIAEKVCDDVPAVVCLACGQASEEKGCIGDELFKTLLGGVVGKLPVG